MLSFAIPARHATPRRNRGGFTTLWAGFTALSNSGEDHRGIILLAGTGSASRVFKRTPSHTIMLVYY